MGFIAGTVATDAPPLLLPLTHVCLDGTDRRIASEHGI